MIITEPEVKQLRKLYNKAIKTRAQPADTRAADTLGTV